MKVYEVISPGPHIGDAGILPLSFNDDKPMHMVLSFAVIVPLNGKEPLDFGRLREATTDLLKLYPALAGRQALLLFNPISSTLDCLAAPIRTTCKLNVVYVASYCKCI